MSTSKFFTWSKGDRKHASTGIGPGPIEYIPIKGMGNGSDSKPKFGRKPLPLDFTGGLTAHSDAGIRANETVTLHEAAVQSATSLMTAMSDILKSPQLSAHLLGQQNSGGLTPNYGRPRSRTAPPTPLVEASLPDPVELPASEPVWCKTHFSAQSVDSQSLQRIITTDSSLTSSIVRPHSSPQDTSLRLPMYPRKSSESFSRGSTGMHPGIPTPRRQVDSLFDDITNRSQDSLLDPESQTILNNARRSSLQAPAGRRHRSSSTPGQQIQPPPGPSQKHMQHPEISDSKVAGHHGAEQEATQDLALMSEVTRMRAAHEIHLSALKTAHDREIESHRAYIALLEQCRTAPPGGPSRHGNRALTIETPTAGKTLGLLDTRARETGSLQSLEEPLESERRTSTEAVAEVEALKRKLSLVRKAQSELGDVRRERDQLKEARDRNDRRINQLKDIIKKAKDNEKSLREENESLQASLELSNMERVDVLEGLVEAQSQIGELVAGEKTIGRERDELRRQHETLVEEVRRQQQQHSDFLKARSMSGCDSGSQTEPSDLDNMPVVEGLRKQLELAQESIDHRDVQINDLRCDILARDENATVSEQNTKKLAETVLEAEAQLDLHKKRLSSVEVDLGRRDARIRDLESTALAQDESASLSEKHVEVLARTASATEAELNEYKKLLSAAQSDLAQRASASGPQLEEHKKQLSAARADRDRYESLLVAELRKQTKAAAQKPSPTTAHIQKEAAAAFSQRLDSMPKVPRNEAEKKSKTSLFEKELRHCVEEIIMYRLDIKGYKKDLQILRSTLREADAKIEALETRPRTSDSRACKQTVVQRSLNLSADITSGLGISMQLPITTDSRERISSLANARLSASSTPHGSQTSLRSPAPGKPPVKADKELPKPPVEDRSPSPYQQALPSNVGRVERQETLRSLSESIISSYGKRGTPEQGTGLTPQLLPRGRSSDPLKAQTAHDNDAVATAIPFARYTPDMLKTQQQHSMALSQT